MHRAEVAVGTPAKILRARTRGEGAKEARGGVCTVRRCARAGAKANPGAARVCPGAGARASESTGFEFRFGRAPASDEERKEKGEG